MRYTHALGGLLLFVIGVNASSSASAQFIPLNARLTVRSLINMTVTQNGPSQDCEEVQTSPSESIYILQPEIGAFAEGTREGWCGSIRVRVHNEITVTHIEQGTNHIRPDYGRVHTTISMFFLDGTEIIVGDQTVSGWYFPTNDGGNGATYTVRNQPGVVFHHVEDLLQGTVQAN